MNPKNRHIIRFIWCYLNQPLFNWEQRSTWNFSRFWHNYQVSFLKECWEKEHESTSKNQS